LSSGLALAIRRLTRLRLARAILLSSGSGLSEAVAVFRLSSSLLVLRAVFSLELLSTFPGLRASLTLRRIPGLHSVFRLLRLG
jgi:hypothetical protein